MKQFLRIILMAGFVIFPVLLYAQDKSKFNWVSIIPWVLTLIAIFVALYQYRKRIRDAGQKKHAELKAEKDFKDKEEIRVSRTAEEMYCDALKEELGTIHMLGSPDIESKTVKLEDKKGVRLVFSYAPLKREKWGTGETCALQRGFILLPSLPL